MTTPAGSPVDLTAAVDRLCADDRPGHGNRLAHIQLQVLAENRPVLTRLLDKHRPDQWGRCDEWHCRDDAVDAWPCTVIRTVVIPAIETGPYASLMSP